MARTVLSHVHLLIECTLMRAGSSALKTYGRSQRRTRGWEAVFKRWDSRVVIASCMLFFLLSYLFLFLLFPYHVAMQSKAGKESDLLSSLTWLHYLCIGCLMRFCLHSFPSSSPLHYYVWSSMLRWCLCCRPQMLLYLVGRSQVFSALFSSLTSALCTVHSLSSPLSKSLTSIHVHVHILDQSKGGPQSGGPDSSSTHTASASGQGRQGLPDRYRPWGLTKKGTVQSSYHHVTTISNTNQLCLIQIGSMLPFLLPFILDSFSTYP